MSKRNIPHDTDLTDSCPECGRQYRSPFHECLPPEPEVYPLEECEEGAT